MAYRHRLQQDHAFLKVLGKRRGLSLYYMYIHCILWKLTVFFFLIHSVKWVLFPTLYIRTGGTQSSVCMCVSCMYMWHRACSHNYRNETNFYASNVYYFISLPLSLSLLTQPYGSVLPGAVVRYSTRDRLGRRKKGVATLHSGYTHQLPFIVFGLGETPSLVEELEVHVHVYISKYTCICTYMYMIVR